MVTLTSVNNLQASLATAQRRVEQGQNQVQRDSEQLAQSRQQLVKQQEQLRDTERSSQQARADATPAIKQPQLDKAIEIPVPQKPAAKPVQPVQPQTPSGQLNSIGQTIGRLIDTTA